MPRVTRAERLAQITALRNAGLTHRQIGAELGLSKSTVQNLLYDPDGSKQNARRERYRRPCPKCGKLMDGSNGYKSASRLCFSCEHVRLRAIPMIHGTYNAYQRGCRCRPCRAGMATYMRDWNRTHKRKVQESTAQRRAYTIVWQAVRKGDLTPATSCQDCGDSARRTHNGGRWLQAHHDDYTKPLAVRWLCPPCHKAVHKAMKEAA